jgi:hypothetical protein
VSGTHGRTRTAIAVYAAAAVLVAGAGAIAYERSRDDSPAQAAGAAASTATSPEPTPTTTRRTVWIEDLPVGAPTRVPWWQHGRLHFGQQTIATPLRTLVYRGGTTIVGRSGIDGAAWYLVVHSRLRPLVTSDAPLMPVVSSDGARVAWVEEVGSTRRGRYARDVDYNVVEYDVDARRVIGTLDRGQRVQCCDAGGSLAILGIDLDGRVLVTSLGRATIAWKPGHGPVPITGHGSNRLDGNAWPGGVTWQGQGPTMFDLRAEYGEIDARGVIRRVGEMPTDQTGAWSPDGSRYAYPGIADGSSPGKVPLRRLWVRTTTSDDPVELQIPTRPTGPAAPSFNVIAWESDSALIVEARQAYGRKGEYPPGLIGLLRCDAVDGRCERVAGSPSGDAVLPDAW